MAFGAGDGGPRRAMTDINVTPLVDVMLVLLIIFMVTAPLIQSGVKVDLPRASAQQMEHQEEKLVLTITRDRRVYLGNTEIPPAAARGRPRLCGRAPPLRRPTIAHMVALGRPRDPKLLPRKESPPPPSTASAAPVAPSTRAAPPAPQRREPSRQEMMDRALARA